MDFGLHCNHGALHRWRAGGGDHRAEQKTGGAGAAAGAAGCAVVTPAGAPGTSEVAGAALGGTPSVCAASAAHKKLQTVTEITTCEICMSLSFPGFLFALLHGRTRVESAQNAEIESCFNRRRLAYSHSAVFLDAPSSPNRIYDGGFNHPQTFADKLSRISQVRR